jgi:cytoskeletal protein CcmA (bactofilin family)
MVPNVLLNGTIKGDVKATKRVELGSNARVVGNVQYNLIEMAIGAEVNGKLIHESEAIADRPGELEAGKLEAVASVAPARDESPLVAKVNLVGE